jgi:hypothetical protein
MKLEGAELDKLSVSPMSRPILTLNNRETSEGIWWWTTVTQAK